MKHTEEKMYLKFDTHGNTSIVKHSSIQSGFSYRRLSNLPKGDESIGTCFNDTDYIISEEELSSLGSQRGKIVLIRLSQLAQVPKNNKIIELFPAGTYCRPTPNPQLPSFSTELGMFKVSHFRSFFLTQNFSSEGKYQLVYNRNGIYYVDIIDDFVPIYQSNSELIWGMTLEEPWVIVLIKFWAKICGGYHRVKTAPPFVFLEFFSNSNWKYFDLQAAPYEFLSFYTNKTKFGKFVVETKNDEIVKESGLSPRICAYEITNIFQKFLPSLDNLPLIPSFQSFHSLISIASVHDPTASKLLLSRLPSQKNVFRQWVLEIRSTIKNSWTGQMSILDSEANEYYKETSGMSLSKDFMIKHQDFLTLFNNCYITSKRDLHNRHHISDFHLLTLSKKAKYLKFDIYQNGWFDFCIKQIPSHSSPTCSFNSNQVLGQKERKKLKLILVKENTNSSPSTFNEPDYLQPNYDTYEIQYIQQKNSSKLLEVVKGTYILKLKIELQPQSQDEETQFVVSYVSNNQIEMKEYFPSKQETSAIMRTSMGSLMGLLKGHYLDKASKYEEIVFGNVFEDMGYGFIGARVKKHCPYSILVQVEPELLNKSGYKLKNQFKQIAQPFSILLNPGDVSCVVVKRIKKDEQMSWPPNGIKVFRQIF